MDWSEQTTRPPLGATSDVKSLAVIAAIVVVFAAAVVWLIDWPRDEPRDRSWLLVQKVAGAVERFKLDVGRYPHAEDGGLRALLAAPPGDLAVAKAWGGPYIELRDLKDVWEQDLVYVCPGKHNPGGFDLISLGRDGAESDDDITNWEKAP